MTESDLLSFAKKLRFDAAILPVEEIPVNPEFRRYCEENRCGQYSRNHSCPPESGTPDELHERLLREKNALVLKTEWELTDYGDRYAILHGKEYHNENALRIVDALKADGHSAVYAGCSCCSLCRQCSERSDKPCPFPERRYSCVSAYCIDVSALAERCGLAFAWDSKKLFCYSLIAFG